MRKQVINKQAPPISFNILLDAWDMMLQIAMIIKTYIILAGVFMGISLFSFWMAQREYRKQMMNPEIEIIDRELVRME